MSPNYGCFTTMRIDPPAERPPGGLGARGWARHVARLQRDTAALFGTSVTEAEMVAAVQQAVAGVHLPVLVRLAQEPRHGGELADHRAGNGRDNPAMAGLSWSTRTVTPSDVPLRVRSVHHDRMRPEMKHTLTSPELAERDAAVEAGFDDAVFVTAGGELSEGTTWSLVLGRPDGTWVTPSAPSLPSVTVALASEVVPIVPGPVRLSDLASFDRAAALGSGRGVHPIASIDDHLLTGSVGQLVTAYDSIPRTPLG